MFRRVLKNTVKAFEIEGFSGSPALC